MVTDSEINALSDGEVAEVDGGPRRWMTPVIEAVYSRITPRADEAEEEKIAVAEAAALSAFTVPAVEEEALTTGPLVSRLQPGRSDEVLADLPRDYWSRRLREYQQRKVAAVPPAAAMAAAAAPGMPAIPGINNWVPIGPTIVARGQAVDRPAVGGRIARIAIASGGDRLYVATANGGVFRSDDGGLSWYSTMDGFDQDPNNFASASLICGAIALDPTDPDRVFVGTGEGDTDANFTLRLTNFLPSYRGIGPIISTDGGATWTNEASSPDLAGFAFYEMAVDPGDTDNVVAATTNGLYQRTVSGGVATWQRRRTGNHCSVVVARTGSTTTFYAAEWSGRVYRSTDGATWTGVGTSFPTTNVGRIALGVQPDNPNILYALLANNAGALRGVYRLDGGAGAWNSISGTPNLLPGGQGDFDLCIAVDPNNANRIYLGGDRGFSSPWPANIQRCIVSSSGGSYSMTTTYIGSRAHSDVHALAFEPGDSNRLWTTTDGGCFLNSNPAGSGSFAARNTGLSCLCMNFFGMSPTEPAIIYCGMQDNGTARYLGEEVWRHVLSGDGGYCVVHPTNPFRALAYANGKVYRTSTGGGDYSNWSLAFFPGWFLMAEPLVGAPGSERVALGAGNRIYVSDDFGDTWPDPSLPTLILPAGSGSILSMVFASTTRLFVGTTNGRVFQADLSGGVWSISRIDNVAAGPLPLTALITDIAVDWSAAPGSIYICLGGSGDARHVWHYNGTSWQNRSGSGSSSLLDVEHNAIIVDPLNPANVYVGANIGVWHSPNSGADWTALQNGLPDAPVFDLQIHNSARLLRASTHGRGLYEYRLDPPILGGVELYMRDTMLDTARGENTDGRNDPSLWPTSPVYHFRSPNIKVDVPTPFGYQTPTNQIDYFHFHEVIVDGSQGVATIDPPAIVYNRVYALVHNRGPVPAESVRVVAAVTNASTVLSNLPVGYAANIQAGTSLPGTDWTTLGSVMLSDLRPGIPQVAAFDLPSNVLPLPASLPGQSHFCLMTFAHSGVDPYMATETHVDTLTVQERKVAQKNLHIVQFVGTPPPPSAWLGTWARLDITGFAFKEAGFIDLTFDLRDFKGSLQIIMPNTLAPDELLQRQDDFNVEKDPMVMKWYDTYSHDAERLFYEGKFDPLDYERLTQAMKLVAERPVMLPRRRNRLSTLRKIRINAKDQHTIFMRINPLRQARIGQSWEFSVIQRDTETEKIQGGVTYSVRINRPAAR